MKESTELLILNVLVFIAFLILVGTAFWSVFTLEDRIEHAKSIGRAAERGQA